MTLSDLPTFPIRASNRSTSGVYDLLLTTTANCAVKISNPNSHSYEITMTTTQNFSKYYPAEDEAQMKKVS
jgi:hypothetical protein